MKVTQGLHFHSACTHSEIELSSILNILSRLQKDKKDISFFLDHMRIIELTENEANGYE